MKRMAVSPEPGERRLFALDESGSQAGQKQQTWELQLGAQPGCWATPTNAPYVVHRLPPIPRTRTRPSPGGHGLRLRSTIHIRPWPWTAIQNKNLTFGGAEVFQSFLASNKEDVHRNNDRYADNEEQMYPE